MGVVSWSLCPVGIQALLYGEGCAGCEGLATTAGSVHSRGTTLPSLGEAVQMDRGHWLQGRGQEPVVRPSAICLPVRLYRFTMPCCGDVQAVRPGAFQKCTQSSASRFIEGQSHARTPTCGFSFNSYKNGINFPGEEIEVHTGLGYIIGS